MAVLCYIEESEWTTVPVPVKRKVRHEAGAEQLIAKTIRTQAGPPRRVGMPKVVARGESIMAISAAKIQQLIERHESGQILESDLDAFIENPTLWRTEDAKALLSPAAAQAFWQGVYDELGIKVTVPAVPKLTKKQMKSCGKFNFLLVYLPAITEEDYPEDFVKPAWGKYLDASKIERKPLEGRWVAIETIVKPDWDNKDGYPDDRLMAAVKHPSRFNTSHDQLTGGILADIAKVTGFPKKGTRLPTAEEWNFIGNLFNWLSEHRSMNLPDLGSTRSWEWCENAYGSGDRLSVGGSGHVGLAHVYDLWPALGFRVLAVL